MIFVTDAEGDVTYVSPDWCLFTGRTVADAAGQGWLHSIHPDDQDIALTFLHHARGQKAEYSFRHRLRRADGVYIWVGAGAVPSFGPPGHTFLGYLGSLTQIGPSGSEPIKAYGIVGRFTPPPPHPATLPTSPLELVADHLLIAHGLIEADGGSELLSALKLALRKVGALLSQGPKEPGDRFH